MAKRSGALIFALVALCLSETPAFADRAHDLAKKAAKVESATCEGVDSAKTCHRNYPTGCTASQNPRYDAYLNYLKNQMPKASLPVTQGLGQADFKALDEQIPDTLKKGTHAAHAGDLAALGEGNITALVGYLYFVQVTGAETTNCQLTGPDETDFHIGIGFDATEAQGLRDGQTPSPGEFKRLQQTSVVVEMTPHYRARYHPAWTSDAVTAVVGRQVKVVGQLLMDNEHLKASDNCVHPEADTTKCWRASAWELHPVIQFYVCDSGATCAQDSPDWTKLEDLP